MTLSSFSFSTGLRIGETLALNNVNENYIEINRSASSVNKEFINRSYCRICINHWKKSLIVIWNQTFLFSIQDMLICFLDSLIVK